jgi:hypothetical protein
VISGSGNSMLVFASSLKCPSGPSKGMIGTIEKLCRRPAPKILGVETIAPAVLVFSVRKPNLALHRFDCISYCAHKLNRVPCVPIMCPQYNKLENARYKSEIRHLTSSI